MSKYSDALLRAKGYPTQFNARESELISCIASNLSVATANIADGAVTAAKLATDAVETAKIKDLNVTTVKLAASAVTVAKLADDAVETAKIKAANVTLAKLAAGIAPSHVVKFVVLGSSVAGTALAGLLVDDLVIRIEAAGTVVAAPCVLADNLPADPADTDWIIVLRAAA